MVSSRSPKIFSTWHIWLACVEEAARADALARELALMHESRSWKLTAPLRASMRLLGGSRGGSSQSGRPELRRPAPRHSVSVVDSQLPDPLDCILSRTKARDGTPRIYVDVTALELEDLGAGIQRVTRRVLGAMYADSGIPFTPTPVCLRSDGHYYLAHRFVERFLGLPEGFLGSEEHLSPGRGDVLLGLDLCREFVEVLGPAWAALKKAGIPVLPVVYDVLPVERPDWFPEPVSRELQQWLDIVSAYADLAICISATTRDSFARVLSSKARNVPPVTVVPMGADGLQSAVASNIPLGRSPRQVLMVGTIEPRKGHGDILDALDRLWAEGSDIGLVIVGHAGWQVDPLLRRIRRRARNDARLTWFEHADDRTLQALYLSSSLLVAASEGEGFGLPILEAARAGCQLLLRDLPVFREVAGASARYFTGPEGVESALRQFSGGVVDWPAPPEAGGLPIWNDTARAICAHAAKITNSPVES